MTKKSGMLKVVSIIIIIFAAIAICILIGSVSAINAFGGQELLLASGIDPNLYTAAVIFGIVSCVVDLFCGVLGLLSKSKKLVEILGLILIIFAVVSLILNAITGSFSWTNLIGLILPLLYFIGAKMCVQ